jgi:hypothetical protein
MATAPIVKTAAIFAVTHRWCEAIGFLLVQVQLCLEPRFAFAAAPAAARSPCIFWPPDFQIDAVLLADDFDDPPIATGKAK